MSFPMKYAQLRAAVTVGALTAAWIGMAAGSARATFIPLIPCHDTAALIREIKILDKSTAPGEMYLAKNCTYTVTEPAESDPEGSDGLPDITGNIKITGRNSTIERSDEAARFRLFHVEPGGTLNLTGITLTSGIVVDHTGGAIDDYGDVTLTGTNIIGDDATIGGGLFIGRGASATIDGGSFQTDAARDTGGAIHDMGNLTVAGTYFNGNVAVSQGGAVEDDGGTATLNDVTMTHNAASNGGGAIAVSGDGGLGLSGNSKLTENLTLTGPGAISNASALVPHIASTVIIRDNTPTDCAGSPMEVTC